MVYFQWFSIESECKTCIRKHLIFSFSKCMLNNKMNSDVFNYAIAHTKSVVENETATARTTCILYGCMKYDIRQICRAAIKRLCLARTRLSIASNVEKHVDGASDFSIEFLYNSMRRT